MSEHEQPRDIHGQFCGQWQPHSAHRWEMPVPFGSTAISMPRQCAGYAPVFTLPEPAQQTIPNTPTSNGGLPLGASS